MGRRTHPENDPLLTPIDAYFVEPSINSDIESQSSDFEEQNHWSFDFFIPFLIGAVMSVPAAALISCTSGAWSSGIAQASWAGVGFVVVVVSYFVLMSLSSHLSRDSAVCKLGCCSAHDRRFCNFWGIGALVGATICMLGIVGFVKARKACQ